MPRFSENGRWILPDKSDAADTWFTPAGIYGSVMDSQGVCNDCGAFVSRIGFSMHEQWHKWLDGKVE